MTTPLVPEGPKTRERPILFSAPMVRALIAGRKTQTRRVMKPQPALDGEVLLWGSGIAKTGYALQSGLFGRAYPVWLLNCPYGVPGDLLYVRETWKPHSTFAGMKPRDIPQTRTQQVADWNGDGWLYSDVTPDGADMLTCDDEPTVWRLGKADAGRKLDGVIHDTRPGAPA